MLLGETGALERNDGNTGNTNFARCTPLKTLPNPSKYYFDAKCTLHAIFCPPTFLPKAKAVKGDHGTLCKLTVRASYGE